MRDDSKQKEINTREQISRSYTWVSSSLFLAESVSFFETNFHSMRKAKLAESFG